MEFLTLSATFGKLNQNSLSLSPGLNIIEAANESGKSTWMAFLKVMLYGLNTRDRGPAADKNRYMPWDGSTMQGRIDLLADGRRITVTRSTARAGIPMGAFSATYTGTAEPIPGLTSSVFGETVLGVPQDVYERSAFIRQSGISIDQTPALEQRITSLITSGEEDSSFADTSERLRKQLNRRRYHRSGLLPQLEGEIESLESTLDEIRSLEATVNSITEEQNALNTQEQYLRRQIDLCAAAEQAHRIARLTEAREALSNAEACCADLSSRARNLPAKDELSRIAADLTAAEAMTGAVEAAKLRMQECTAANDTQQQLLSAHPFAPLTPSEAQQQRAPQPPRSRGGWLLPILSALFCAALFPVLYWVAHLSLSLSLGSVLLCAGIALIFNVLLSAHREKHRMAIASQHRSEFLDELEAYTLIYEKASHTKTALTTATDAYQTLFGNYHLQLERALTQIKRFSDANNAADARTAIRQAAALQDALQDALQRRRQAQLRCDLLAETTPDTIAVSGAAPELSRTEAEARLTAVTSALDDLQRQLHTLQGRIDALGDAAALSAALEQKRAERDVLRKEYDALALALEVMTDANAVLQTRFSPALGEKAANIFTKLTKGKYNTVLLDRKMVPSAHECGDSISRAATSLSQGTADQLYLAVRLAVCDMVLPQEKCIPICLDDALVTFDDTRAAAALDYLVELSKTRQVLLFTCQKREHSYLKANHPGKYHFVTLS